MSLSESTMYLALYSDVNEQILHEMVFIQEVKMAWNKKILLQHYMPGQRALEFMNSGVTEEMPYV